MVSTITMIHHAFLSKMLPPCPNPTALHQIGTPTSVNWRSTGTVDYASLAKLRSKGNMEAESGGRFRFHNKWLLHLLTHFFFVLLTGLDGLNIPHSGCIMCWNMRMHQKYYGAFEKWMIFGVPPKKKTQITDSAPGSRNIGFIAIRQFTSAAVKEPQSQCAWIHQKTDFK